MALYGARFSLGATRAELFVYWGGFLLLLLIALYAALLDLRYIRLQYLLGQREIFQETLGSEEFRATLRKAQEAEGNGKKTED